MNNQQNDTTAAIELQVLNSAKLAEAHGHGWAIRRTNWEIPIDDEKESFHVGDLPATEEQAAMASEWSRRAGGLAFAREPGWNVFHRTTSGRVTWSVAPSGFVRVRVWRPGVVVLDLEVCPHGQLDQFRCYAGAGLGTRHVHALWRAAGALLSAADLASVCRKALLMCADDDVAMAVQDIEQYHAQRVPDAHEQVWLDAIRARASYRTLPVLPGETTEEHAKRQHEAHQAYLTA